MPALLDAADIEAGHRLESVRTFLDEVWASEVRFARPVEELQFRIELNRLGPVTVSRTSSNGLDLRYRSVDDAPDEAPALAFVVHQGIEPGVVRQEGREHRLVDGQAVLLDLTRPYDYRWERHGSSHGVVLDLNHTGLTPDDVRAVVRGPVLATPLGKMVLNHVRYVLANVDTLSETELGRVTTARTTSDLLRALVAQGLTGGTAENRRRADVRHETELSRILAFARQRLRDPDLSPASLAAAHHVSERHLYTLCARAGLRLGDWLVQQRLDGACADLVDPALAHRSIEFVAGSWGFRSAAHFSRRFKDAYGRSPRDWRRRPGG